MKSKLNIEEYLGISSKAVMIKTAEEALEKRELLEQLVEIAISNRQPFAWRGAWALASAALIEPQKIQRFLIKILNNLEKIENDTQLAQLLKTVTMLELNVCENELGKLLNLCFDIIEDPNKKAAARVYSMEMIYLIAKIEKDLADEYLSFLENMMPLFLEPSTRAKARNTIKQLNRLKKTAIKCC